MLISIKVKDSRYLREHEQWFHQFPIRIGRNSLNDLVIDDGFVSQWHGIIRGEDHRITFMDLGSTNGSSLAGNRLPKDVAVPWPVGEYLNLACFQLALSTSAPMQDDPESATRIARCSHPPTTVHPADVLAQGAGDDPTQLERCHRLLQGFSDAFVALRNGHQEFGEQVGVRPIAGNTPLHRARTGAELVEHLLDPTQPVDACLAELKSVFADMGIHQIAFMEGIVQSVRGLLESLDSADQPSGPLARILGRRRLADQEQRLASLIDEDQALHAELFGESFARAYASVALGSGQE
jgi:hypothetical protein